MSLDFLGDPGFPASRRERVFPFKQLRLFKVLKWRSDSDDPNAGLPNDLEETASLDVADIVSSQFRGTDMHAIVLDIDVPAALVPSTTYGHSHLYIDATIPWEKYVKLLDALADAGVIERGYAAASKARKFTAVRLPWVSK